MEGESSGSDPHLSGSGAARQSGASGHSQREA
jgi:hypothetical protein